MTKKNLEQLLAEKGNVVDHLRNSQIGAYVYPVVPSEFTSWRDEQWAWRNTAVLFDQTHHMAELMIEGPDTIKLLSYTGINSFANFPVNRAKQFVPVSHDGYVIGDVILFHLAENQALIVGRVPTINWVEYHAKTGGFKVTTERDDRSPSRPGPKAVFRKRYRYQVQGPNAWKVLEKLNGGPIPDVKFFTMDKIRIAGRDVRCLRHGMSGAPGLEIWGPYEEADEIRDAIFEAGKEFGLRLCGSRAYATNTLESGWIPSPLPGIYTGDGMLKDYRDWLGADSYEATGSIGGSFVSDNIEDYYVNPFELGYDFYIGWKKDDFVGKAALEKMKGQNNRKKVTFEWNAEDVVEVIASAFRPGEEHFKWIDFPQPNYASSSADMVLRDGKMVGMSMFNGYSYNERCMLSLGVVDADVQEGDVLTLVWGEPDGGSAKTSTERPHKQAEIRVRVSPTPYAREARENYADSWRSKKG